MSLAEETAAFEAEDYTSAFRLLKSIAEQGNAEAQCIVTNMYHLGLSLKQDISEAQWYRKSSEQGCGVASNNLAGIFQVGDYGVVVDQAEAEQWYHKAREQGFVHTPT